MKIGSGAVLIVFALLILYVGVSGKYDCFSTFFSCLFPGRSIQLGGGSVAPIPAKAGASSGGVFGGVQAGGSVGSGTPSTFPMPGGGGCFLPGCGNPFDPSGFGSDFGNLPF